MESNKKIFFSQKMEKTTDHLWLFLELDFSNRLSTTSWC